MYKIYKIKNKKRPYELYVGSTKQVLEKRFQGHVYDKRSSVYQYIQRDGRENFEVTIIDYAENKKEALEKEEFWTLFLKGKEYFLYNKNAGNKLSKEQKKKLLEVNTGRRPTEETRRKISEANKGKHHSEKTKEKLRIANTGRHSTEETRKTMSEKAKERLKDPTKNPMYGKHHSKETKIKISKARKGKLLNGNHPRARKIRCIDDNKVFNCIKDAANFYNINRTAIINNCKKKSKSCAGHHFEYI